MNRLNRVITLLAAWMALLTNIRLPDGFLLIPLTILKIVGGSFTLFLTVFGGLGALIGLLQRDRLSLLAGLTAVILALKHSKRVIAPHREFEFAFGQDWQQRIPHHLTWRLKQQRYSVLPEKAMSVPFVQDFVIGTHLETGEPILADIWQPPDNVPRTAVAVLYLHGGGWHYGAKDSLQLTRPLFQYLAGQGHLIVDVAYTLAPKATLLPMVADVKRAIVWLKANADRLHINPERIVLVGESAGAHLALLAAYTPNHPILDPADVAQADTAVHGVISIYGVADLVNAVDRLARFRRIHRRLMPQLDRLLRKIHFIPADGRLTDIVDLIPDLMGGRPEAVPDHYQLASPITHVGPHCPPTLLINGTHDAAVDIDQHRQLQAALYRHQVTGVHVELESADHLFDLIAPRWSPAAQAALYDLERFLALLV